MKRLGLPKRARLAKRRQFLAVTERGKALDLKFSGPCFLLLGRANGLAYNRLGVTVSKKAAARAVDRNRIKRIVREFFRANTGNWPKGFDLVFIARTPTAEAARRQLWDELRRLGRKLAERREAEGEREQWEPPLAGFANTAKTTPEARPKVRPLFIKAIVAVYDFIEWLLKNAALVVIHIYQRLISPLLPPSCRFRPTCSRYAVLAITTHGLWRGSYLTVRRLLKCHPFHPGGYDPVPPAKACECRDEGTF